MQLRRFWLVIGVWAGVCHGEGQAATKWTKVQADDFVVLSDASEKDAVEFTVGYSAFRHTLREFLVPGAVLPPSTVVVFRRQDTLQGYVPQPKSRDTEMVSFSTEVDAEALVALSLGGDRAQALELTYEFETMWVLRRLGYFLPVWMGQGAGEVLASLQVKKDKCVLGDGPERMESRWRQTTPIAWEKFFNLHNESPEYAGKRADGMVQAQAWALMHRILLGGDGGRERFEALAGKLRTATGPEAVEAVLGVAPQDLTKEIAKHFLRRNTRREIPFDSARVRAALKPVAASEPEVQVHLANLLVAAGKPDEAEAAFLRGQAVVPEAPAVKEWLARRELRNNRPEDAARLYREAIAGGSRNPVAYQVSADQRMTESRSSNGDRSGGGGPDIETSLAEIRQAIRLNPGSGDAYRLLGRALFLHPRPAKEHAAELSRGIAPGADGGVVQFYRASLYERLGLRAEYVEDLTQLTAAKTTSASVRRLAQERLEAEAFRGTQEEVEKLAKGKHYADARAVVTKARRTELSRETDEYYDAMLRWLTEKESWEALSGLANDEKWTEVRAAAKRFLEEFPHSRVAGDVRKLDAQAKARSARTD